MSFAHAGGGAMEGKMEVGQKGSWEEADLGQTILNQGIPAANILNLFWLIV